MFGGQTNRRWIGWVIAFAALPSIFALQVGQIGPILLLGAVLFLECERRGYHFAAGAATVLLAIKPHLAYLVWLAILCDAITNRRWRMLLGGAVVGLACAAVPLIFDPHVWQHYADALGNRPPSQWASPTIGTVLRYAFGEELFRLQFVPVLLGLAWFAYHWYGHRSEWNWNEQLPLLLLVSFVTAPYGAWPFDMVLLLPAVMWLVLRSEAGALKLAIAGLIAVNVACLVLNLLNTLHVLTITSFWFVWVSPAVLLLYVLTTLQVWRTQSPNLTPKHFAARVPT
jgi:hypothetical protein